MQDFNQRSDAPLSALLQQIAAGDQAAFKQVYQTFYKRLYQFSFAIVKSRESAEEIVEDVFVRIWQQKADLLKINNLKVYLYTAVKNTSLNILAKRARESITQPFDHIDIELSPSTITPEQIMITAEMFRKMQEAVDMLPPRCKMIFKLVREDGLKYKEVGQILNISVNSIDVQMAIAVKRIGAALATDFGPLVHRKFRAK